MIVQGVLNHKKRQDVSKITRSHYYFQKGIFSMHKYYKKAFGLKKNIKKHCLLFHCIIRVGPMLGIGYVAVIWIPCCCSECSRKLASTQNIRQDKCTEVQYKCEHEHCNYWPILGSYNNFQIIKCIDSIKHHEATKTDLNVLL